MSSIAHCRVSRRQRSDAYSEYHLSVDLSGAENLPCLSSGVPNFQKAACSNDPITGLHKSDLVRNNRVFNCAVMCDALQIGKPATVYRAMKACPDNVN